MQWRVGEITDTNAPAYDPTGPRAYEITSVWHSGDLTNFASDLTLPVDALKVGHQYRVRVQMKDNTGRRSRWSAPVEFTAGLPDNASALVNYLEISEFMFDSPAGSDYEFVELHNSSPDLSLSLEGAKFTSGTDYTFPVGTSLPPDGFLVLIASTNVAAFRAYYGLSNSVSLAGPYSGSLANDGEEVTLRTGAGGLDIVSFTYRKGRGWPPGSQGGGHSLVPLARAAKGRAAGALDYPGNWRASSFIGGSPGRADPPVPSPSVLLNEIIAHTDYFDPLRPELDSNDWIELFNASASDRVLLHYFLSDDPANLKKWAIPSLAVPAHGWRTVDEANGFHTPITNGFGIDKAGEQILLSHLPGTAEDRVVDAIAFKGQQNERSLSRYPDGAPWWFTTLRTSNTFNGPALSGVIINEVMYHPPDLTGSDNLRDEFVEIFNPTGAAVTLQDTNGAWRLDGGIGFDFAPNTVIPAGGVLLVVNFDPADAATLQAFRSVYGLTNGTVAVYGPYSGKLGNRSDRVALEKPQYPDLPGDPYSWVIVDEVIYGNQVPWPDPANGLGASLQRVSLNRNGNDPDSWSSGAPNPGLASIAPMDRDGDGMPDTWETNHGLDPAFPGDAAQDADGDGMSNLEEYLAGNNPRDPLSVLRLSAMAQPQGGATLRFTAMANHSYSILFRTSLNSGLWVKLMDIGPLSDTALVQTNDSSGLGFEARYYRVVTPHWP